MLFHQAHEAVVPTVRKLRCPVLGLADETTYPAACAATRKDTRGGAAGGAQGWTYNPALDGLRAVAIALVILSHAHAPLFDGAFYGVDLFFVLSGFLITSLLLQELQGSGRIAYWQFYRRRFYRLMPALALFLGVYCLVAPLLWPDLTDIYSDSLVSILYLADYGIAFFDSPDTLLHMWSLSVEEHFYLVWPPLVALLVHRTPRGQRWRPLLGLVVLAWAWRVLWVTQDQQFYEIFFRFDTRASGLLTGALLAALVVEQPRWFQTMRARLPHFMWLVLAVPLLLEQAWDDMNALVWGMTVVEWATLMVIVAVLPRQGGVYQALSAPVLVRIGKLSYGIYLWHYPVVRYLRAELPWPAVVVLGFLISLALAAASFHTVERWALRRRDGKPGRPARVAPPAETGAASAHGPASAVLPHWVVSSTEGTAPIVAAPAMLPESLQPRSAPWSAYRAWAAVVPRLRTWRVSVPKGARRHLRREGAQPWAAATPAPVARSARSRPVAPARRDAELGPLALSGRGIGR